MALLATTNNYATLGQDQADKLRHIQSLASVATMASAESDDSNSQKGNSDGDQVHDDLMEVYVNQPEKARQLMEFRENCTKMGDFADCGDGDGDITATHPGSMLQDQRVKVIQAGPIQKTLIAYQSEETSTNASEEIEGIHEDLLKMYPNDLEKARRLTEFRLRYVDMGDFADCGDIHSLEKWGTGPRR